MTVIATCCMHCEYDKQHNISKYLDFIDGAAERGASLVVLPEQSLQGYLHSLDAMPHSDYAYQYENAEVVPDGPTTQILIKKAKDRNIHIIWGMTERDERYDYVLYNTACLVGPEGFIGKYRKVHLPGDELHIYTAGTDFPVFDTVLGRIGMLICYDKAFPESTRELALGGADILVLPTAWPVADASNASADKVHNDYMYRTFRMYDSVRASENQLPFVSANQTGRTGDITYTGCSAITDGYGSILATTGYDEGIVDFDFDLKPTIHDYKTNAFLGLSFLKDRNSDAYRRMKGDR